ncbi:uncharacterized protein DMAD_08270 [Drosophila madeirensis]|uniref:Reticulon-like protein n=1 Tax=Drosophila madeirensis TaxID=30013 RepID=A0AAU9ESP6_DROMD
MATPGAVSNSPRPQEDLRTGQMLQELKDLVLWRNFSRTMLVFTSILILLVDIMQHSAISVVSMLGIAVILVALGYRFFVEVMELWNRRNNEEEYYSYRFSVLMTCNIPQEEVMHLTGVAVVKLNAFVNKMIELLLVKDLHESLKLLAILCFINMMGDYFNVMTLLLFGHVLLFTLPNLYELKKTGFNALLIKMGVVQIQEEQQETVYAVLEGEEAEQPICESEPLAEDAAPPSREPNVEDPKEEPLKEQNLVSNLEGFSKMKKPDLKFLAMFEEVHDPDCSCAECDLLDVTLVPKHQEKSLKAQNKEQKINYLEAIEEQEDTVTLVPPKM